MYTETAQAELGWLRKLYLRRVGLRGSAVTPSAVIYLCFRLQDMLCQINSSGCRLQHTPYLALFGGKKKFNPDDVTNPRVAVM
jgi:hypothetical protein